MQTEHSNTNNNNFIHYITAITPLINLIHSTIIKSLSQFLWTSPIGLLLDLTRQFDDNNDDDYDDYRTATTTITTTGRRLRPSRLQDGDYDHHDYRTATTTITTTGRRLRQSRLQGGDYDHHDYRVETTKDPASRSRCPPRNVHDNVPPNTYKLHQNILQTRGRPATLSNRLQIKRNNILNNMHII